MKARLALVFLGGGLAACAADPETTPVPLRCSVALCGSNSPIVGHYGIDDQLNLDHQKNADGFTVLGMSIGPEYYELDVVDSKLYAYDQFGNKLKEKDLVGAKIWLDYGGVEQYAISIEGWDQVHEVVPPYGVLDTYLLDWGLMIGSLPTGGVGPGDTAPVPGYEPGGPVCPEPVWDYEYQPPGAVDGDGGGWDEAGRAGMHFYDALVFEGDRIHADTLTIDPYPDNRWFNIGCGAHMLAKLRLTRTTINHATSWKYVQATMKMFGADYCGKGTPMTVSSEPLVWRNYDTMKTFFGPPTTLEARWGTSGALCIGEPRLLYTDNENARQMFPDIQQAIIDECAFQGVPVPPPCGNPDATQREYGKEIVTSANWNY